MISVENLTKRFAAKTAIEGMSFNVEKGEILGFLGPNGAGKTTTMRIITGYMPSTDGTVKVDGFDVAAQVKTHRRLIEHHHREMGRSSRRSWASSIASRD